MRDLARADFRTIKTFITNNVTAERLLVDIILQNCKDQPKTGESSSKLNNGAGQSQSNSGQKPFKNSQKVPDKQFE